MENNKNQTPVTEEVKEWSIEFMRSVETEGYESMVRKLNELTPELMISVIEYLRMITDYCVENDLKDFLEGVNTYKELILTKVSKKNHCRTTDFVRKKFYSNGKTNNWKILNRCPSFLQPSWNGDPVIEVIEVC